MKNKVLIILTFLGVLPCMLLSITLNVKQDGSGDYTQIQDALDAADPGDTILVHPGRYFENLEINKNNITLKSLEAISGDSSYIDSTIIDGTGNVGGIVVQQNKTGINVRGFSITNGVGAGFALGPHSDSCITNCEIFKRQSTFGGGINIASAKAYLSGVNIHDNYALSQGGGIYVSSISDIYHLSFDPDNRCSIYNNRSGAGQDIFIRYATRDLDMPLNTFSVLNPSEYHVVYLCNNAFISNFQINFDILNAYHEEIDSDLYVSIEGDDANDGLTPATALKTIHEAIYRTASNSESKNSVFILPGEYSRTANDQVFPIALKQWVKVQGSGIDITKIICEPSTLMDISLGGQVFKANVEPHIYLDGMSITARGFDNYCIVLYGSYRSTEAHLSNLRIHDIPAGNYSGIISKSALIYLCASGENESTFENIIIEDIDTGVVELLYTGAGRTPDGEISAFRGKIKNLIVRNFTNDYTSQSVWTMPMVSIIADEELIMENCEFRNLTMLDDDSTIMQISGVQFPQQQNHFTLRNCLIADNVSPGVGQWGGGIATISGANNPRTDIINCTFAGNQSDTYILNTKGEVNFINTIFDNDSEYQIRIIPTNDPDEQTHLTFDYCLIKDGIDGILEHPVPGNSIDYRDTNIDGDPLFADSGYGSPGKHNYNLSEYSPCVDSGTPDISDLDLPPYDLAGNIRVWNGRIDMGCYEYNSEPWVSNEDLISLIFEHLILEQNYPNPFNPETTIAFELREPAMCSLKIYNMRGQVVRTLVNEELSSGRHSRMWDGLDDNGSSVASGMYLYRVKIGAQNESRKMILMK
ncbi:MAG: T9SS type A sorting domain-containing protein [Candidatus Cloacimonetes bacterium]|nr:T9SS type A sorting domain-containing protein [Candidatus Cloacimonadota bacterium]